MDQLYHCSDCGRDVTALEGLPGGRRCLHCKSQRISPLVIDAAPLAAVDITTTSTVDSGVTIPAAPVPVKRKTRKKAAR